MNEQPIVGILYFPVKKGALNYVSIARNSYYIANIILFIESNSTIYVCMQFSNNNFYHQYNINCFTTAKSSRKHTPDQRNTLAVL